MKHATNNGTGFGGVIVQKAARCFIPLLAAAAFFFSAHSVNARVFVAQEISFELPLEENVVIPAGRSLNLPLSIKGPATLSVDVRINNKIYKDLNVYVCDEASLKRFSANQPSNCQGVNKGRQTIQFHYRIQSPQRHYLVLDNSYALVIKKKASVSVTASIRLPPQKVEAMRAKLTNFRSGILGMFDVPAFDLSLKPCGAVNAYSEFRGGHITICSELFFGLLAEGLEGAVESVMMHELAHTLLNLWGLPNWDNEETADEFALVILFWRGKQQSALDWIRYYAKANSERQAAHMLRQGMRHPLSIQRARNIERILTNPRPVVSRWNRLIYPYLTVQGLRSIVDNPGHYGDRALAQRVLGKR